MPQQYEASPRWIFLIITLCLLLSFGCAKKPVDSIAGPVPITGTSASAGKTAPPRGFHLFFFSGEGGEAFQNTLSEALFEEYNAKRGGKFVRNAVDIGNPGHFEYSGSDAIVTCNVESLIEDAKGSDMVTVLMGTGQFKMEKDLFGKESPVEIKRSVMKGVPYVVRQASFVVDLKVVQATNGTELLSDSIQEKSEEKFGGNEEYVSGGNHQLCLLPSKEQTIDRLSKQAAQKIAEILLTLE